VFTFRSFYVKRKAIELQETDVFQSVKREGLKVCLKKSGGPHKLLCHDSKSEIQPAEWSPEVPAGH